MQDMVQQGHYAPDRFADRLAPVLERVNDELRRLYDADGFTVDQIVDAYAAPMERLAPNVEDVGLLIDTTIRAGKSVLFEGAQATMLDIDHGTYPFVTSSSPSAGGACTGSGVSPTLIDEVVGIVKVYTSRVGTGPFPTELTDATGDWIVERGHEYGTTTGRRRRGGWIDIVAPRYATRVNGFKGLALTRLDVLSGLDEVRLCVDYRTPDGTTSNYVLDASALGKVEPIYETMPGWSEEFSHVREWDELPQNARAYCTRVSELLGVPIYMISVGAERNDLVGIRWPL